MKFTQRQLRKIIRESIIDLASGDMPEPWGSEKYVSPSENTKIETLYWNTQNRGMDYHERPQAISLAEALGLNIEDLAVWQIIHPDGEIEEPWYWDISYSNPDPSDHFGFTKEQISKVVKSCNKNAKNYQLIPKFEFDGEGHYVKLDAKSNQPLERVIGDIKWDLEEAIKEIL